MGLSTDQQRFLAHCYEYLQQQHRMVIVPLQVSAEAVKTLGAIADGWTMNLNLGRKYADKYACDCRELIQNFRDQCAELSRTHNVRLFIDSSIDSIQAQAATLGIKQVYFLIEDLTGKVDKAAKRSATPLPGYWDSPTPFVLGHVVEYVDSSRHHCLDICNHGTLLNPSMLSLGVSEKNEKPYTAGHFGEGMKVQINRLLADSKCSSIAYITGRCYWDFKHCMAQHCNQETLHVCSTRLPGQHGHPSRDPARMEETICTVQGYRTSPAVDRSCYLFLQPQPSKLPVIMSAAPPQVQSQTILHTCQAWFPSIRVDGSANTPSSMPGLSSSGLAAPWRSGPQGSEQFAVFFIFIFRVDKLH